MRKTLTLFSIFCLCLFYTTARACPPPTLPYRVLAESDLIVGVALNQQFGEEEIPIHQLIKGKHDQANITVDLVPWRLSQERVPAVYAIVFLYKTEEYGIIVNNAQNGVLLFQTMDDAEYAMERFRQMVAIQERGNNDREILEWLTESIELGQQPYAQTSDKFYLSLTQKKDWFYDATRDLKEWKFKKDQRKHWIYDADWPSSDEGWGESTAEDDSGWDISLLDENEWNTPFLDSITEILKERIFAVFRNTPLPEENFLHLVTYLGIENAGDQLLNALYQMLDQENRKMAIAYFDVLTAMELPTAQQEYLSKLILYHYKVLILPKIGNKNIPWWEIKDDYSKYLVQYTQSEAIATASKEWIGGDGWGEYEKIGEKSVFKQLISESEKHLNMCDDWRISQLTGKRKLWACTEESAFAQAESFDEESIDLQVFPNPSNGNFNIKLKLEKDASVIVDVLSIDGKFIIQQQLTKEEGLQYHFQGKFELEGLAAGIYFLQIRQRNQVHIQKIVVE